MHIIHAYITADILKLAEYVLKIWGNIHHNEKENLNFYDWAGLTTPVPICSLSLTDSQV